MEGRICPQCGSKWYSSDSDGDWDCDNVGQR